MRMFPKNWKTTLAGVVGLLTVVSKIVSNQPLGLDDLTAVTVAIGLIAAKDHNVSHLTP